MKRGTAYSGRGMGTEAKSRRVSNTRKKGDGIAIPIQVFADHRPMRALGAILAAHPTAKDSCMRDIISKPKLRISNPSFPAVQDIKQSLHASVCHTCEEGSGYGVQDLEAHEIPQELLYQALPKQWIRLGGKEQGKSCPLMHTMLRVAVTPELGLSATRHAYAHLGGWESLDSDDRYRIAHEVNRRLDAADRIRFAHVEQCSHRADEIREYWAELLAFALGIAATNESEWRRLFLARAVRRSAGSPLAYPMPETGEEDLRLVDWYINHVKLKEPWSYATQAQDWIQSMKRSRRMDRVRHVISGFPPGRLRMSFSGLVDHQIPFDHVRVLNRMNRKSPMHLIAWLEHAYTFADAIAAMTDETDESSFSTASDLTADWEHLSPEDRRYVERAVHQYIQEMQDIV